MENMETKKQEYKKKFLTPNENIVSRNGKLAYISQEHYEKITALGNHYKMNISQYLWAILEDHFNSTREERKELLSDAILESIGKYE